MRDVIVWHPVRDGFRLEVLDDGEGPDRRMTIIVNRERHHLYPARNEGRGEWEEIGRLTTSSWDTDVLLCFADTHVVLLSIDNEPVAFGNDSETWGAVAPGQLISENGEIAAADVSDDGNEITYRLLTIGAV